LTGVEGDEEEDTVGVEDDVRDEAEEGAQAGPVDRAAREVEEEGGTEAVE